MRKLVDLIAAAPDVEVAELNLKRLEEVWPHGEKSLTEVFEQFPLGGEAVVRMVSWSHVNVGKVLRHPNWLLALCEEGECLPSSGDGRLWIKWKQMYDGKGAPWDALREFKAWELLRVALFELSDRYDVRVTGVLLARLARFCIRVALDWICADCSQRWGVPGTDWVILGMGKLGGEELNYSSDIDLVGFYREEGEVRSGFWREEYFSRMLGQLAKEFSASAPEGFRLFPVDYRLRPEGDAGVLCRSQGAMENYYAAYGEVWERMALIKAQPVYGSQELAYEFGHGLQSFIYPKHFSADTIDEIVEIKGRIERNLPDDQDRELNVKLGVGGIREVEFCVQALQLLHGARHAFLQESNTLRAITALTQCGLLPMETAEILQNAYLFLRRVEHRIQIMHERQRHSVPCGSVQQEHLAKCLGFPGRAAFMSELRSQQNRVRAVFEGILGEAKQAKKVERNHQVSFRDEEAAQRALASLGAPTSGHVSSRTRRLYQRLEPLLLHELERCADPDTAIVSFVQFVQAYGMRSYLYEVFSANPRFLELVMQLFDKSRFLTRYVLRRPQLLEEIARAGLQPPPDADGHTRRLVDLIDPKADMTSLHLYKQTEELRIGLRDILGFCDVAETGIDLSHLADAVFRKVLQWVDPEGLLTVVAFGKWGGEELSYGSDLDLIILGSGKRLSGEDGQLLRKEEEVGRHLVQALSASGAEGRLFAVDVQLRPEGKGAPLVMPLDAYEDYLKGRAQLWEVQALTHARVIGGRVAQRFSEVARLAMDEAGKRQDLNREVKAMFQKILEFRTKGEDEANFKTGTGGLVAMEFATQVLLLKTRLEEPNTFRALRALHQTDSKLVSKEIIESALFLRRCELALRRYDNRSVSQLPSEDEAMERLAQWLGFPVLSEFRQQYRFARRCLHAYFENVVCN